MSLKTERFLYTGRNYLAGLTDVKAQVRRNGTLVGTDVATSEIGRGEYELVLTPAMITAYGGPGYYDVYINSVTAFAPGIGARWILANDNDDLRAGQTAIETKLDTTGVKVSDIRTAILDGTSGTAALRAQIDSLNSAIMSLQFNTRFVANVPAELIRPATGKNRYRIPINVYNETGSLEDPDNQLITVAVTDESGNDRNSYLVGYTTGPVNATYISKGKYRVDLDIPSTAEQEQLNFSFAYVERGLPLENQRTTQVLLDVQSAGFALEATAQDIRTRIVDIQPRVSNIQAIVSDPAYGNAALMTALNVIKGYTDSLEGELGNSTYGLAANKTALDLKASQTSVNNIQADATLIKGVGFDPDRDSLAAISSRTIRGGFVIS